MEEHIASKYAFNHIFFPPERPQEDDNEPELDLHLLHLVIQACDDLQRLVEQEQLATVRLMSQSLRGLLATLNSNLDLTQQEVEDYLMSSKATGTISAIFVRRQNAALLAWPVQDRIVFEAFELSPTNEAVTSTVGRLTRTFPGCVLSIDAYRLQDNSDFRSTLCATITTMSSQIVAGMQPTIRKAKRVLEELRDTTHPAVVTELLMGFLRGFGIAHDVEAVQKNMREDILWNNCKLPWKRSAFWLFLRVTLQIGFSRLSKSIKQGTQIYKKLMLLLLGSELDRALRAGGSSEKLYIMQCKVMQRLVKVGNITDCGVLRFVTHVASLVQDELAKRWHSLMKQSSGKLCTSLSFDDLDSATLLSLPRLDKLLARYDTKPPMSDKTSVFHPSDAFFQFELDSCVGPLYTDLQADVVALASFEDWVATSLARWLDAHLHEDATCQTLATLALGYQRSVANVPGNNPERHSIMILTVTDLWVACDKVACTRWKLLRQYDPEFPVDLLESLVLVSKADLTRIKDIEDYINSRRQQALPGMPGVLTDFGHRKCFAVKFFDDSDTLKNLRSIIESHADIVRQSKCQELEQKKAQYTELMQRYHALECTQRQTWNKWTEEYDLTHDPGCARCRLNTIAQAMEIEVHEWPLPHDDAMAKAVVFELAAPDEFRCWRNFLAEIYHTVYRREYQSKIKPSTTKWYIEAFAGLSSWSRRDAASCCIRPLSSTKPHTGTHRRIQRMITITEAEVCLPNGLSLQYYDFTRQSFTAKWDDTDRLTSACTYTLPRQASNLQRFISRPPARLGTSCSPNDVISSQYRCPSHLSLEEYRVLCNLPVGYSIQWQNILSVLAVPTIDLRLPESCLVMMQIMNQVGPSAACQVLRQGHLILANVDFASSVLNHIEDGIQKIKRNWEASGSMSIYTFLALKLLSLCDTSTNELQNKCLKILESIRIISMDWLSSIRALLQSCANQKYRNDLTLKATYIALICCETFDLEEASLSGLLRSSISSRLFFQACIVVQEYESAWSTCCDDQQRILIDRQKRICLRVFRIMDGHMDTHSKMISQAVHSYWSKFNPSSAWQPSSAPYSHWISSTFRQTEAIEEVLIITHYNILTGELLVNGQPLSHLPANYTRQASFTRLFDNTMLDVVPSELPGFSFVLKQSYKSFEVHLGSEAARESLAIYAVRDNRRFRYVSPETFDESLPYAFRQNYAHWYDEEDKSIEFRPIETPWEISNSHWTMRRYGSKWTLVNGEGILVPANHQSTKNVASIFVSLEEQDHLHLIFQRDKEILVMDLPRLQLTFYIRKGSNVIQSKQFRTMIIDCDQFAGCLVGFKSKLILRCMMNQANRRLLIPEGEISYAMAGDHTASEIVHGTVKRIHVYEIDEILGRLCDNGSIHSRLYICYLHIITSSCNVDPLTKSTGVEQAISILGSAAIRSFFELSDEHIQILTKIAAICPKRRFYPANMQIMQTVTWNKRLPVLSQDPKFLTLASSLLEQAKQLSVLKPDSKLAFPVLDICANHLLERAKIRDAHVKLAGFGAEDFSSDHDVKYKSRDRGISLERSVRVSSICQTIVADRMSLRIRQSDGFAVELWKQLCQISRIEGENFELDLPMAFDQRWLESRNDHLYRLFLPLKRYITDCCQNSKFQLTMVLSTMSFHADTDSDMDAIKCLVAARLHASISDLEVPSYIQFHTSEGTTLKRTSIEAKFSQNCKGFNDTPDVHSPKQQHESKKQWLNRRQRAFNSNKQNAIGRCTNFVTDQWPVLLPNAPTDTSLSSYVSVQAAMPAVRNEFRVIFANRELRQYLDKLEKVMRAIPIVSSQLPDCNNMRLQRVSNPTRRFMDPNDIFRLTLNQSERVLAPLEEVQFSTVAQNRQNNSGDELLNRLSQTAKEGFETRYVNDLEESFRSLLTSFERNMSAVDTTGLSKTLESHELECSNHMKDARTSLKVALALSSTVTKASGQHYIRESPRMWLQRLRSDLWGQTDHSWQKLIINYAMSISALQRARRLVSTLRNNGDINSELQNRGHENWSPFDYPEWLLIEVESSITVREVQSQIAQTMLLPPESRNTVMQLNMGEGKSTVILPLVASKSSDGSNDNLVRVVVGKPQAKQTAQMLTSKVGNLLNRRIYYLPISRSLRFNQIQAEWIRDYCLECKRKRGILLLQPEHILSFKLMGLESFLSHNTAITQPLLTTYREFEKSAKDIVDESDENFSVKFELIYTMGSQSNIELSPQRWQIVQQVLDLVPRFAKMVQEDDPRCMSYQSFHDSRYPQIRFLNDKAGPKLAHLIGQHICEKGLRNLPISRQSPQSRKAILWYLTVPDLTATEIESVESNSSTSFWTETTQGPLLLLRGLLALGVLNFAFTKRWRVGYGRDFDRHPRTRLAVPYRAKDNPASRSEFSHPDVVIMLTCMSYYYRGLDNEEMFIAIRHLSKSDEAESKFTEWVRYTKGLKAEFQQLSGINLTDREMCIDDIFPILRFSKGAVDYYLSVVVFPKEVKVFPERISASGWDIGEIREIPTTGFSGTCDTRAMLPTDVHFLDDDRQRHTNSLVLCNMMNKDNGVHLLPNLAASTFDSNADLLLDEIVRSDMVMPKVIIDVGAQVLEYSNLDFAKRWLDMTPDQDDIEAAVFFDDKDVLSVVDRSGQTVEPLQISPFLGALGSCIIFLDQVHTRGTDLKLPTNYQAVVTLGPDLTKDRLAQACMRMRKLGKGQSIIFYVPDEIRLKLVADGASETIEVVDIICWSIKETWADFRRMMPLWATQGQRYLRDRANWNSAQHDSGYSFSEVSAANCLEPDTMSLSQRYGPRTEHVEFDAMHERIAKVVKNMRDLNINAKINGAGSHLNEEQERELSPEIERERQLEKPSPLKSLAHKLHPDMRQLVQTGNISADSHAVHSAFHSLSSISAVSYLTVTEIPCDIYVTHDFSSTVGTGSRNFVSDLYLRPVQWILTSAKVSGAGNILIVISPYEANALMSDICRYQQVSLHLYTPHTAKCKNRAVTHFSLFSCGDDFEADEGLNRQLAQLGLFSGQIYFPSYRSYQSTCHYLGLSPNATATDKSVAADGFSQELGNASGFGRSPVRFMQELIGIRRDRQSIDGNHAGRMLSGEILEPSIWTE